jgi:hypothetical protein
MSDFYPVIARAVSQLPNNSAQARKQLYEDARQIIVAHLRAQDPPKSGREIMRAQAALEAAIQKVELESRSTRPQRLSGAPSPRSSTNRAAAAIGQVQAKPAANSLNGVFQELQPLELQPLELQPLELQPQELQPYAKRQRSAAASTDRALPHARAVIEIREPNAGPAAAQRKSIDASARRPAEAADEFDGMLHSVGAMLFGTAFVVAMLAIIGLIYINALVLVAEDVIGYPTLLVAMAIVLGLLLLLSRAIIRKVSMEAAVGALLRLVYPTVRRVFLDFPANLKMWSRSSLAAWYPDDAG